MILWAMEAKGEEIHKWNVRIECMGTIHLKETGHRQRENVTCGGGVPML